MSDNVTSVLGFLPKKVEEIPIAFWNTFGVGFFLIFSTYSYSIVSIQDVKIEIILLLSIFLSLLLTMALMFFLALFKIVITYFFNHKKTPSQYDLYLLTALSSFGFSIIKFATKDSPANIVWVLGILPVMSVLWVLLSD